MPIISTAGLSRTFRTKAGPVEAVRGIDLTVAEGEILGFLGPNGAGKTTTLRMLTTLLTPTGGAATVAGRDLMTAALASLSYALAVKVNTPQEFGPAVNALTMPSMLLSGLMLPMTLGPDWLDVLSHFTPFRYLVDAVRDAYVGEYTTLHMLYGVLMALGFTTLTVTVGTRVFRTAGA